jgi:hypothetical protein
MILNFFYPQQLLNPKKFGPSTIVDPKKRVAAKIEWPSKFDGPFTPTNCLTKQNLDPQEFSTP